MFAQRTWRVVLAQRTPPLRAARSGDTVLSVKGVWGETSEALPRSETCISQRSDANDWPVKRHNDELFLEGPASRLT